MGIRLIVEVLDHWQDAGLTAGERDDLVVLAENANERSRLTWGPVHAPYILRRVNKSPAAWKNSIGKLLKKGVLVQHTPGRLGQVAVYRLASLCPEAPHSGVQGFCTKPERVIGEVTLQGSETGEGHLSDDPQGHSSDDPEAVEGHLRDVGRVIGEVTPTPLTTPSSKSPSTTTPSSPAREAVDGSPAVEASVSEGGGGGDSFFEKQAQDLVARLDMRGRAPDKPDAARLLRLLADALAAGWSVPGLLRYLDISDDPKVKRPARVYLHRLGPDRLPAAEVAAAVELPPLGPDCFHGPGAESDVSLRVDPLGGWCRACHPDAVAKGGSGSVPPACARCLEVSPGAATNMRLRQGEDGGPCEVCHPSVATAGSGRAGAVERAESRLARGGDWSGAGTDERVAGWFAMSERLKEPQAGTQGARLPSTRSPKADFGMHKPYSGDPWDQLAQQVANGTRPEGADQRKHCGVCEEYSRTIIERATEDDDEPGDQADGRPRPCPACHPVMSFG